MSQRAARRRSALCEVCADDSAAMCDSCGHVLLLICATCDCDSKTNPPLPRHRLTVYVKRRSGQVRPMTSEPMAKDAAEREANELRALGYRVEIDVVPT